MKTTCIIIGLIGGGGETRSRGTARANIETSRSVRNFTINPQEERRVW